MRSRWQVPQKALGPDYQSFYTIAHSDAPQRINRNSQSNENDILTCCKLNSIICNLCYGAIAAIKKWPIKTLKVDDVEPMNQFRKSYPLSQC